MGPALSFLSGAAAVLTFLEAGGYAYHRFVMHEELARYWPAAAPALQRLAARHRKHHEELYPPHKLRPATPYVVEDNLGWYLPAVLVSALAWRLSSPWFGAGFLLVGWPWGLFTDWLHMRFHVRRHVLSASPWFQRLERIHDLHHADTSLNFTIVIPLLDQLAGTFREPPARSDAPDDDA